MELQDCGRREGCWDAGEELLEDGTVIGTRTEARLASDLPIGRADVTPGEEAVSPQRARVRGAAGSPPRRDRRPRPGCDRDHRPPDLQWRRRKPLPAPLPDRRAARQGQPGPDRRRSGRQRRRRQAHHNGRPRSTSPSTGPCTRAPRRSSGRPPCRGSPTATSHWSPARTTIPELGKDATITGSTRPVRSTSTSSSTPCAGPSARRSATSSRAPRPSTPATARRRTRPTSI